MLTAISFCHCQGIVHCDVKPENFLSSPNSCCHAKLIDFGTSCFEGQSSFDYIQSRFYRAPEVILEKDFGRAVDIWSFGCVLAELIIGEPLFPGTDEKEQLDLYASILGTPSGELFDKFTRKLNRDDGTRLRFESDIGNEKMLDLIYRCLSWDPGKRISADDALTHPALVAPFC
jgi:dual specificity tyrosine-phosphorylation-regulated kinase 2/3/4